MALFYEVVYKQTFRSIFRGGPEVPFDVEDPVVIEADGRAELGKVVWKGMGDVLEDLAGEIEEVARKATQEDIEYFRVRRQKELAALRVFGEKIEAHKLPMKPVDVEFEDDERRILFYFTAPHRVDFRALVRDLARIYHTRIELRQISPRQEVQRAGGFGACGRPLCCASFLKKIQTVPAHAARMQALAYNPSKLAGVCGQLKCCLRYELDFYKSAKERFPDVGTRICCCGSCCRVEKNNIFDELVQVRHADGTLEDLPLDTVKKTEVQVEGGRDPEEDGM